MNNWLQAMKQWAMWLVGDAPLPGHRSRVFLAWTTATVVTAAVIAIGVPSAIPSSSSASAAPGGRSSLTSNAPSTTQPAAGLTQSAGVPSGVGGPGATSTVPGSSGTNAHLSAGKAGKHKHAKAGKHKHAKAGKHQHAGTTTSTPSASAPIFAVQSAAPTSDPTMPVGPTAILAMSSSAPTPAGTLSSVGPVTTPVTQMAAPPAPLATDAQALVDSALVSWKAPAGAGAGGFDVFAGVAPGMEFPIALNGSVPVAGNSYLVSGLAAGRTYYFTVRARVGGAVSTASNEVSAVPLAAYTPLGHLNGPVVSMASTADGSGYWLATATGAVSPHGTAVDLGGTASLTLAAPIVKIVADPKGADYWQVAADGGVFTHGSAHFEGAASSMNLNSPIVDLVPTADGLGYWEVGADGGVFAYGDAAFAGSLGGTPQASATVGMVADPSTGGYWLISADCTVTGFDAPALALPPGRRPDSPVVAVTGTVDGKGFWAVTRTGSVFAFGDAVFHGPTAPLDPAAPVTAVTVDPAGRGYWLAGADGGVYTFGPPFYGAG